MKKVTDTLWHKIMYTALQHLTQAIWASLHSLAVREFAAGTSKTITLPAGCAYVKLYSWDKASLAPVAAVRIVY